MINNDFRSRPYEPDADRARLEQWINETTAQCSAYTFGHIGNVSWSMFYSTTVDPTRSARLWEDARGNVLGLGWFDDGELVLHVHPALRGNGVLEAHIIAWAEQVQHGDGHGATEVTTSADTGDSAYIRLLEHHGFVREGDGGVTLERSLVDPIPMPTLPKGVTVRHVLHSHEYMERVDAHRDAFAPSRFTLEAYQNIRTSPGYDPELDLVAVLPDGTFASYCICWWDADNKRGMFEPVGTRGAWQRQGFARATMLEGLRRLRVRGAVSVTVGTAARNLGAVRLYESLGMRIVKQRNSYVKGLAPQPWDQRATNGRLG